MSSIRREQLYYPRTILHTPRTSHTIPTCQATFSVAAVFHSCAPVGSIKCARCVGRHCHQAQPLHVMRARAVSCESRPGYTPQFVIHGRCCVQLSINLSPLFSASRPSTLSRRLTAQRLNWTTARAYDHAFQNELVSKQTPRLPRYPLRTSYPPHLTRQP